MKKTPSVFLTIALLVGLLNATPAEDMLNAAEKTEAGLIAMADQAKNTVNNKGKRVLDPVAYEALILAAQFSEVNPKDQYSFKYDYVAKAKNAIRKNYIFPSSDEFLPRLITHENPKVRAQALSLINTFLTGISNKNSELCQKMLDTEKDPIVLSQLIQKLRNEGGKNPAIAKFLVAQLDNPDAEIRYVATIHSASYWNRPVQALAEKYASMMLNEKDPKVLSAVYRYAGKLANDAVLPSYEQLLADKAPAKVKLQKDALTGLMDMWWSFPLFNSYSEKAYNITLKVLKEYPVAKNSPTSAVISALKSISTNAKTMNEWKAKCPWFKAEDLQPLVLPYLTSKDVNGFERGYALTALYNLGYTKEKLAEIVAQIEKDGTTGMDLRQIQNALSKLK